MGRRDKPITIAEHNPLRGALAITMRSARDSAGMTNKKIAKVTGFDPSTISTATNGEDVRGVDVFRAYMEACNVDPDTLMDEYEAAKKEEIAHRRSSARRSDTPPFVQDQTVPAGEPGPWWRRTRRERTMPRVPHGLPVPVPTGAQTAAEFVDCMKELRKWAGMTYGNIERITKGYLPRSTLHGILKRKTLPIYWEAVDDFLYACGVGGPELTEWARVWTRLDRARP